MNEIPVLSAMTGKFDSETIDELPVAYVEMDAHGTITRANRLARSLHSSHAGELIGRQAWELMPAEEQELSRAAIRTAMETGEDPPVGRRSIFTISGQFRIYERYRSLIRDAQGRPAGMRVASVDVTEAHKAREKAERARVWMKSVLDSLADAILVTDALGFIRTVNPAAEELFGWKAAELEGKVIEKALPMLSYLSDDKTQVDFTLALEKRARGVAVLLDRERRELRVEIRSSPMVDKERGFTTGVVNVLRRVKEAG